MRAGALLVGPVDRTLMALFVPSQFPGKIIILVKWLPWKPPLVFPTLGEFPYLSLSELPLPEKAAYLQINFHTLFSLPNDSYLSQSLLLNRIIGSFLLSFISVSTLNYNSQANKIRANVLNYGVFGLLHLHMMKLYDLYDSPK